MRYIKLFFYPIKELYLLYSKIIISWPNTRLGLYLRRIHYFGKVKLYGKSPVIESGVIFNDANLIEFGNNCIFGRNVVISAGDSNGIYIGNLVAIADGTFIRSANHRFDNLNVPIRNQGHDSNEIEFNNNSYSVVIEDDVWIGARAILLSGAHIGKGSIISAGSVVSNNIPPYSIVVGNPARVVANRKMLKK
jgi:acetyltransferase-like isoleucine patch superfamily enzyme